MPLEYHDAETLIAKFADAILAERCTKGSEGSQVLSCTQQSRRRHAHGRNPCEA